MAGMGDGWDLGLTEEERKARPPSIELRKRLCVWYRTNPSVLTTSQPEYVDLSIPRVGDVLS